MVGIRNRRISTNARSQNLKPRGMGQVYFSRVFWTRLFLDFWILDFPLRNPADVSRGVAQRGPTWAKASAPVAFVATACVRQSKIENPKSKICSAGAQGQ